MKKCKLYMTKRKALGLTQKELAEMAGVSTSIISRFEQGEEVSAPYVISICKAIEDEWRSLSKMDEMEVRLKAQILQLEEEDTYLDKMITLGYIQKSVSNLQIEMLKSTKEERP